MAQTQFHSKMEIYSCAIIFSILLFVNAEESCFRHPMNEIISFYTDISPNPQINGTSLDLAVNPIMLVNGSYSLALKCTHVKPVEWIVPEDIREVSTICENFFLNKLCIFIFNFSVHCLQH
jgi:hypothetical protein